MKILVLGQGGREHALVRAFARSPSVSEVHAIPGNDGMAPDAVCHKMSMTDSEALIQFCLRTEIDFVFIGPDSVCVAGIADPLRERGILVVGPSQEAARLEGSKVYAKRFMVEAQVPTAAFEIVKSVPETLAAAKKFAPPYILKADGLAEGKGVFICPTLSELQTAAENLFVKHTLGESGKTALLEENMPGWELSYILMTDGKGYQAFPMAQDHKRLKDLHQGPNTGGMGTVAPLKLSPDLDQAIREKIIAPTIKTFSSRGYVYRGILFVGIMITSEGPKVVEYNVRFGDPETQVILPLIENDLGQVFLQLAKGELTPLQFKNLYSCCVILAAQGYPGQVVRDAPITGDVRAQSNSSYFIHAGTKKDSSGHWVTGGGRVLGAIGIGSTLEESIQNAYSQAKAVDWDGLQKRSDIGRYC